ncbi:MAG TPA: discoidin domain-containing protein, partial [Actinopolymorphaceae bacterium]
VQGYPEQPSARTARLAEAPQPTVGPAALRAATNGRSLSLFKLGGSAIDDAAQTVPQRGPERTVYRGTQRLTAEGIAYAVSLPEMSAAVETPRFEISGRASLEGLQVDVLDSRHVRVTGDERRAIPVTVESVATGETRRVTVPAGRTVDVRFDRGVLTPTADLARDRITYPSSPLPPGMSDPDRAVDADARTAWTPGGADRRIVVNLGDTHAVSAVEPVWKGGRTPDHVVETSVDGVTWRPFTAGETARYVSVKVGAWTRGHASLAELRVLP